MNNHIKNNQVLRYINPLLSGISGLSHGFFTRRGGVSREAEYHSLNCNILSSDTVKNIRTNHQIICGALGFAIESLKLVEQVHSADVVTVYDRNHMTHLVKADALVTQQSGILLGINTADCVPILLYEPEARVIAATHAGWKGACGGVIDNTIIAMQKLTAKLDKIHAVIGPCIQQDSYEVDEIFYEKFIALDPINTIFFHAGKKDRHYLFNLPEYCVYRLSTLKVGMIDNLKLDTYSNPELFFSFRRATHQHTNPSTKPTFGTQISVIGMREGL